MLDHRLPHVHLHSETKILPIRNHLDMQGTQFFSCITTTQNHPYVYLMTSPSSSQLKTLSSIFSSLPFCVPHNSNPYAFGIFFTQQTKDYPNPRPLLLSLHHCLIPIHSSRPSCCTIAYPRHTPSIHKISNHTTFCSIFA